MTTIKRSHTLKLEVGGKFAMNVVDNLIIVHHQATKVNKAMRFCSEEYIYEMLLDRL